MSGGEVTGSAAPSGSDEPACGRLRGDSARFFGG
jgi:hypothetical protein